MSQFMLSFSDESEVIELVLIKAPEKYLNRFIYGDEADGVTLVTYPNIYINNLSDDITDMDTLCDYVANITYDGDDINMTQKELAVTLKENSPDNFLTEIKELNTQYSSYMKDIYEGKDKYQEMDDYIQSWYSKNNLVRD